MSFDNTFDPSRGYVALPNELFDIDMSPAAFRTLSELCRMANQEGFCWPSLEQLSDRLGRSKAAISGYIQELRDLELVETITQKIANGFNYRLKYKITFWSDWRSALSKQNSRKPSVRKAECSVQPDERTNRTFKNKSHTNQPTSPSGVEKVLNNLYEDWKVFDRDAPYGPFKKQVPDRLIEHTMKSIQQFEDENPLPSFNDLNEEAIASLKRIGVKFSKAETDALFHFFQKNKWRHAQIVEFSELLHDSWKSHWKRPPNEAYLSDVTNQMNSRWPLLHARILDGYIDRLVKHHGFRRA
ncbi:helix-turn-helix domain-containing protein [Ruegeria sp. HKCCSP335]|uniref:helix-turn-helix domain-containing protein n=1 Tax=Ruegeria sp. HKCCSP335 TaxID=2794833 RepID=UPI001AE87D00|nr:helix-turn-helix domain-containing protein [Ruegeria sp. HKCCSP335]